MPFGPHEAIDRAHPWARPGGYVVKDTLRGAIWKFKKFQTNLFPVSQPPCHHRPTGCPHTRNVPRLSLLGATAWELRPPEDVIFADYFWRILRIAEVNFRVISHVDSLSPGTFSAIFKMGVRGSEPAPPPKYRIDIVSKLKCWYWVIICTTSGTRLQPN